MDFRNVLMAIILSTVVLVGWTAFFGPPVVEESYSENEIVKDENALSPSIDVSENKTEITRSETINKTQRLKVENTNIEGSISLKGAIIDDIIFKNYKENLDSEKKVIFRYSDGLLFTRRLFR